MSDVRTVDPPDTARADRADRAVRRRRGLPGGRAVVGAFLIAAAAVGVFSAYLTATAAPTTSYLVATGDIAPGTRLSAANTAYVPIDLPDAQHDGAIPERFEVEGTGRESLITLGPVGAGELLARSNVVADSAVEDRTRMSFAMPASRALGGGLRAGDRIDVLATYDGPDGPYTTVVVRGIRVLGVAEGGDGIGGAGRVVTVELPDLALAQRLAHALDSADVFLLRSGSSDADTPADYQPEGGVVAPPPADDGPQPVPSDTTGEEPADQPAEQPAEQPGDEADQP